MSKPKQLEPTASRTLVAEASLPGGPHGELLAVDPHQALVAFSDGARVFLASTLETNAEDGAAALHVVSPSCYGAEAAGATPTGLAFCPVAAAAATARGSPPPSLLALVDQQAVYVAAVTAQLGGAAPAVAPRGRMALLPQDAGSSGPLHRWSDVSWHPQLAGVLAAASPHQLSIQAFSAAEQPPDEGGGAGGARGSGGALTLPLPPTRGRLGPVRLCWVPSTNTVLSTELPISAAAPVPLSSPQQCQQRLVVSWGSDVEVLEWSSAEALQARAPPHSRRMLLLGTQGPLRCLKPGPAGALLATVDAQLVLTPPGACTGSDDLNGNASDDAEGGLDQVIDLRGRFAPAADDAGPLSGGAGVAGLASLGGPRAASYLPAAFMLNQVDTRAAPGRLYLIWLGHGGGSCEGSDRQQQQQSPASSPAAVPAARSPSLPPPLSSSPQLVADLLLPCPDLLAVHDDVVAVASSSAPAVSQLFRLRPAGPAGGWGLATLGAVGLGMIGGGASAAAASSAELSHIRVRSLALVTEAALSRGGLLPPAGGNRSFLLGGVQAGAAGSDPSSIDSSSIPPGGTRSLALLALSGLYQPPAAGFTSLTKAGSSRVTLKPLALCTYAPLLPATATMAAGASVTASSCAAPRTTIQAETVTTAAGAADAPATAAAVAPLISAAPPPAAVPAAAGGDGASAGVAALLGQLTGMLSSMQAGINARLDSLEAAIVSQGRRMERLESQLPDGAAGMPQQ